MSASEAFGAGMKGWDGSFGKDGGLALLNPKSKSSKFLLSLKACSSFIPGTKVLMADGSHKAIEDLKVGEKVLATDPQTGETTAEPVLGTITARVTKTSSRSPSIPRSGVLSGRPLN
jgi:hypothetical protein